MKRRTVVAAGVATVAAVAGTGVAVYQQRRRSAGGLEEMWDLSFERPDGSSLAMSSFRGRPLLVNFWATWCAPCIKEMPMLDRFFRDQQAAGWQVLGLAVDRAVPVRKFLAALPVHFPIGLVGVEGVQLSKALGNVNGGLPFTVVFDAGGEPLARKLGALDPQDLDAWVKKTVVAT